MGQAGLVKLTHGGGGNAAVSFYRHFPGFWWPRLPNAVGKDGSSRAGWKLLLQHRVRFSSVHPALTQWARGQPKPHGHRSETATGQAWDGAGKLRGWTPRLAAQGRKRSTARVTSVSVSRMGRGADPAKPPRPALRTPKPPRCPPGTVPRRARLHALPKPPPVPRLRGGGRLATHVPHFLYFCLKLPRHFHSPNSSRRAHRSRTPAYGC